MYQYTYRYIYLIASFLWRPPTNTGKNICALLFWVFCFSGLPLCFLFIWRFLESCDTLVHRCSSAKVLRAYRVYGRPSDLQGIGSRTPHRYPNPWMLEPLIQNGLVQGIQSLLCFRGVHIRGYQGPTEEQGKLLATVEAPRWTRLGLCSWGV